MVEFVNDAATEPNPETTTMPTSQPGTKHSKWLLVIDNLEADKSPRTFRREVTEGPGDLNSHLSKPNLVRLTEDWRSITVDEIWQFLI